MANFQIFWPILLNDEGFYANKPGDTGGETWEGISRNNYPNWVGWSIVDSHKGRPDFPHCLRADTTLQALVITFYENHFWEEMQGDAINNQSIANMIGDWGVNAGLSVPVKHTQIILGVDVVGVLGPKTLAAINGANQQDFFNKLKAARIQFYHDVVAAHTNDSQFLGDWLQRTNSITFQ